MNFAIPSLVCLSIDEIIIKGKMMRGLRRLVVLLAFLFNVTGVQAATIVDTGAYYCAGGVNTSCGGSSLMRYNGDYQYLAAKFSLGNNAVLSDVEGWMNTFFAVGKTLTIAIYGDGGQIPNVANQLYAQAFSIYAPTIQDGYGNAWQGVNGLSWSLGAGNYWVSFEVRPGQNYDGYMPAGGQYGAPNPLIDEAFFYSGNNLWLQDDSLNIGVRIQGANQVPIPATLWLLVAGCFGLTYSVRRM